MSKNRSKTGGRQYFTATGKQYFTATGKHKLPGICPKCTSKLDAVTSVGLDNDECPIPEPGAMTCCAYCGSILVFNRDLSLRPATPDELVAFFMAAPDLYQLMMSIAHGLPQSMQDHQ